MVSEANICLRLLFIVGDMLQDGEPQTVKTLDQDESQARNNFSILRNGSCIVRKNAYKLLKTMLLIHCVFTVKS